jgi:hypothetical protein
LSSELRQTTRQVQRACTTKSLYYTELHRKIAFVPDPGDDLTLIFWTRSGAAETGFPAKVFLAEDVIR